MNNCPSFVAYVDVLGMGNASTDDGELYNMSLLRFREALCESVDRYLNETDEVFAFSDCAFASSYDLKRLTSYVTWLQYRLWEHNIFLKGAISVGERSYTDFAALPEQSEKLIAVRQSKMRGYWFPQTFVYPALLEKNLKGVAVQFNLSSKYADGTWRKWISENTDEEWLAENLVDSCYFPTDSAKKPVVIKDLKIPTSNLRALDNLLRIYITISHSSRRLSRYYVPLIVTWIKSHDFSEIKYDSSTSECKNAPLPLRQLIYNPKIASEVTALVGGDVIFYSLLSKVDTECEATEIIEKVYDYISGNKKLRVAAEFMPEEVCPQLIRQKMIETRVHSLFNSVK